MNNGWVKLHRKILENPIASKGEWAWLWVTLLLKANHEGKEFFWNGKKLFCGSGQLVTGREELARQCGMSSSSVERALNYFQSEHQIEQQKTTKYRLITVLNWKEYQTLDNKTDSKKTANEHQKDTNKNYKNEKNEKNTPSKVETLHEYNHLGSEIIKEMELVDPKNKQYYGNTSQRKACDFLIEEYGLEEVKKRISVLPKTNKIAYFPTITTPVQLRDKWVQLQDAVDRKRGALKEKNKVAFI
jgi:hypothetical protein